ncbi:MAG TPA: phospholipase A, partial [Paraburkholderia sp.]
MLVMLAGPSHATVALLQPPREAAFSEPLQITLLYSADAAAPLTITLPATIRVTLANSDHPPQPVDLAREQRVPDVLHLAAGEYRKVSYAAPWPAWARGEVRIDPVGFDVSPALVAINRSPDGAATAQAGRAEATEAQAASATQVAGATSDAAAASMATPVRTSNVDVALAAPAADSLASVGSIAQSRISYFEPMYFAVGHNGDTNAQLQVSFKYRILMPDDLRSKRLLDNLYFAYTQTSIWDLTAESQPFRDTSYEPQFFYYIPDTGWHSSWFTRMGIAAGIGHESNGKGGDDSRSINLLFMRPTWEFGDLDATHLVVSPKIYYYAGKSGNPDIADYRGYVDLLVKYGSPNGWQ